MSKWMLNRLFEAKDQATPRFAFQGTVNWMRALSILVDEDSFSDQQLSNHYRNIQRRTVNLKSDTFVYENILMSLHNIAALRSFNLADSKYDIVRAAIVEWYYSVYCASKAMIFAASSAECYATIIITG